MTSFEHGLQDWLERGRRAQAAVDATIPAVAGPPGTAPALELPAGGRLITPWAPTNAGRGYAVGGYLEQWQAYAQARPGGPTMLLTIFRTTVTGEWRSTAEFASHMGSWACILPLPDRDSAQAWAEHQVSILGVISP